MASHKRVDSGLAQGPEALKRADEAQIDVRMQQMRTFLDASKALAAHEGYDTLSNLMKREQDLQAELEAHELIVRGQYQKIGSLDSSLKASELKVTELGQTCETLENLKTEKAECDRHIQTLQTTLENEEGVKRKQIADIAALRKRLETSNFEVESLQKNAEAQRKRAEAAEAKVKGMNECMAELSKGQISETAERLKHLWEKLHKFARNNFGAALPDTILKDEPAWSGLQQALPALYLPRTNTQAAKNMRLAGVLSLLASQIEYQLFHPTYLVPAEEDGLWDLLIKQAEVDPNQERAFRKVLLMMLQDEQLRVAKDRKQKVYNQVWNVLVGLVAHNARDSVAGELKKCVDLGYEFWNETKAKDELYFFCSEPWYNDDPEQTIKFTVDDAAKGQDGSPTQREPTSNPVVLRILPHLYTVNEQITPGLVLREHQVEAAKSENADRATKSSRRMSTSRKQPPLLGRS